MPPAVTVTVSVTVRVRPGLTWEWEDYWATTVVLSARENNPEPYRTCALPVSMMYISVISKDSKETVGNSWDILNAILVYIYHQNLPSRVVSSE